jgi:hypothetical protein
MPLPLHPREKSPRYTLNWSLVGLQSRYWRSGENKNLALPGVESLSASYGIPHFYGTRPQYPSSCFQSTCSRYIKSRSVSRLCSHLILDLQTDPFRSDFPTKFCWHSSSHHTCYMYCLFHLPWCDHPKNIWRRLWSIKLLIMQFRPSCCYCLLLPYFSLTDYSRRNPYK